MTERARYREEDGRTCIDVHLKTARHLFDGRDPAPFRERDLDADAAEYILEAVEEVGAKAKLKIVLFIAEEPPSNLSPEVIANALTTHFAWSRGRIDHRIREHFRRGQLALIIGLVVLVVFLTLAELTSYLGESGFREIVREGLVIIGWVAMWRPLELLLYDWWPLVSARRLLQQVLAAQISVRIGKTGESPGRGPPPEGD